MARKVNGLEDLGSGFFASSQLIDIITIKSQGYSFSLWPLKGGYSQKDILETAHSISLYRSMALTQQGLSPASCDMTHEKALMRYGNKKA